jgi:hypothetical protein
MRARCSGALRNLHQRIERHDEEAAEDAEHHQVEQHAPDRRNAEQRQQQCGAVTGQPDRRGEIEIDTEQRQADRAERHQADFDMLAGHPLAEQRTEADTDREGGEQQRHRRLAAAEHVLGVGRELGEEQRAVQPEPRDAENGQEDRAVLRAKLMLRQVSVNGIEIDLQFRDRRRRRRNAAAGQVAGHRDQQSRRRQSTPDAPTEPASRPPASVPIRMATKGAGLDQRIAADQFLLVQMLRQDGVLDRPEQRRMQPSRNSAAISTAGCAGRSRQRRRP